MSGISQTGGKSPSGGASQPRRVILLDHTAALGGGEIALLNLVRALDPARYRPVVIVFAEGPLVERLRAVGCEVRLVPLDAAVGQARKDTLGAGSVLSPGRVLKSGGFILRLRREMGALKKQGAVLVHCNSLKSDLLGGMAARLTRLPVVWHVRDRIVPEYLPAKVVMIFRRLCRRLPAYVVAISESVLASLELPERMTRDGRRACVVHDGVKLPAIMDMDFIEPMFRIGLVGRISPWKGQDVFLKAAAEVHKEFPAARFLIVGAALFDEAAYEKQLQTLTDELGLRGVVEFTGFRSDVPAVMASLDVLVHASTIGEPFGLVVAEGMAAGKAVIATRGGGVPEIVVDGESGLLVPMGDVEALAAALRRLCADPALRARLGAAGRKRVEEHFTVERTAQGVMAVWDRLLGVGAPGAGAGVS